MADPADLDLPGNWGRWGADDELGTLNLIDDDVRAKAAAEVRTGVGGHRGRGGRDAASRARCDVRIV